MRSAISLPGTLCSQWPDGHHLRVDAERGVVARSFLTRHEHEQQDASAIIVYFHYALYSWSRCAPFGDWLGHIWTRLAGKWIMRFGVRDAGDRVVDKLMLLFGMYSFIYRKLCSGLKSCVFLSFTLFRLNHLKSRTYKVVNMQIAYVSARSLSQKARR